MIFIIMVAMVTFVILLEEEIYTWLKRSRPGPPPSPEYRPTPQKRRSLEVRLQALHLNISAQAFYLICIIFASLGLALSILVGLPMLFSLGIAAGSAFLPFIYLSMREEAVSRRLAQELPSALEDLASAMRVRASVPAALREVQRVCAQNPGSILALELERVLADSEAQGMERALLALQERSSSPELSRLAGVLLAFHQAGPDMLDLLLAQAERLRNVLKLQAEIRSSVSEHRLTLRLAPLMAVITYFFLTTDPSVRAFQRSLAGQILVALVAGIMALGYFVIRTQIQDAEP
ncbi:MAG: hypothetical protein QW260_05615 [Thermoproteota archaeon]